MNAFVLPIRVPVALPLNGFRMPSTPEDVRAET